MERQEPGENPQDTLFNVHSEMKADKFLILIPATLNFIKFVAVNNFHVNVINRYQTSKIICESLTDSKEFYTYSAAVKGIGKIG